VLGSKSQPDVLKCSNQFLADPGALDESFDRDGYLFLRNVIDGSAIESARQGVEQILASTGLVDLASGAAVWTGKGQGDENERLLAAEIWPRLSNDPSVQRILATVLHDAPFFIKVVGFHVSLPGNRPTATHQDGLYVAIPSLPFRTFWFPLHEIDQTLGGLLIAESSHEMGWLQDIETPFNQRRRPDLEEVLQGYEPLESKVPPNCWRTATFQAGDMVAFHPKTLHGGLANTRQDRRVRMAISLRAQPASAEQYPVFEGLGSGLSESGVIKRLFHGLTALSEAGARPQQLHDLYSRGFADGVDFRSDPEAVRALVRTGRAFE
jgi:ectoine hydroxylase-related dioxygenase (phytanoyl-CoA dioxygenase family)